MISNTRAEKTQGLLQKVQKTLMLKYSKLSLFQKMKLPIPATIRSDCNSRMSKV